MWGVLFSKEVRGDENTTGQDPGMKTVLKKKLQPDLVEKHASLYYDTKRIYRPLVRTSLRRAKDRVKAVQIVLESSKVDDSIREKEL